MASITMRNLDEQIIQRLRIRAARHGRSSAAEVRAILTEALSEDGAAVDDEAERKNFFIALHERFAAIGGVELDLPPRDGSTRVVDFD